MSEIELKKIAIEEAEVKDLLAISDRIKKIHETLGNIREQQMRYESILVQLRKGQKTWETDIAKKYDLKDSQDWKVDPENLLIVVPIEQTEATEETPVCDCIENCGDDCTCKTES